jgi:hypothetical protein
MWLSVLLSSVMLSHATPRASARPCLRYEPDTVRITGKLARHMFYGAPGFGEDPKHDAREPGYYLELAKPICTVAGDVESGDAARMDVRRVQLVLDQRGYERLRPLLGATVTLRGTLFGAITGHHHAPVLLTVLRPVRPIR